MKTILEEIKREIAFEFPKNTEFVQTEKGLSVENTDGKITVYYAKKSDLARAALIAKANGLNENYTVSEKRDFDDICLMIDCSRNAVRNLETVKKLIRNLAMIGYDSLMLYTEDTYEVNGEPLFGYLRGRYSKAELKELDAYANGLGVELIPCVQTLAHLNQLKRYYLKEFNCFDCADILLVGNERTYQLIDNIFSTISECFTTRRAHIGMDEAWLLGRGVYLSKNGYRDPFAIILEHLYKVCGIAEKYGITPIIWSDMFSHIASTNENYRDKNGKVRIPQEIFDKIPKNLILCHWDYHSVKPEGFTGRLEIQSQFKNELWFAGGTAFGNRGIVPFLSYSMNTAKAAIKAARKFKIKHLVETAWGDNGGECGVFALLPAIMHYAYTANGVDNKRLKKEFKALTGYGFDSFLKLEYGQNACGKHKNDFANPLKYGLYNDPFAGYIDVIINPADKENFKKAASAIRQTRKGQYGYLFETAYRLNAFMYWKYDLGVRLRKAYQEQDRQTLQTILGEFPQGIKKLEALIEVYRKQWLKENKPFGFEIQEIRLGGLKERLIGCKKRLAEYLSGQIDEIPELAEKLLKEAVGRTRGEGRCDEFSYMAIASVNSFDGYSDIDV